MINILCFGDSNTFGTNPSGGRWGLHERWTSVLQDELGDRFRIIEEGLGGRVTVMEDELEGDKNGKRHLPVLLRSHRPLDLVILMLGTNDMKHRFNLLPVDIAKGAELLGEIVRDYPYGAYYPIPQVLLISPIHLKPGIEHSGFTGFSEDAVQVFLISWGNTITKRQKDINGYFWMPQQSQLQVIKISFIWKKKIIMRWPQQSQRSSETDSPGESTYSSLLRRPI